ncbi:MAG: class I SAM-dependent methyltransferase [Methanobacteriota archaeon]
MDDKKFDPKNRERLDSPERRTYLDPDAVVEQLDIKRGAVTADVGAGTGYFSIPLAGLVGGTVKVYALDLSAEMLEALRARAKGMDNISTVLTTEDSIPLDDGSIDLALMVNVFHELDGDGTLREVMRILRPGGRLAIADWKKRPMTKGPPYGHRISEDAAVERVTALGLEFYNWFEPGPYHYGLIFIKKRKR